MADRKRRAFSVPFSALHLPEILLSFWRFAYSIHSVIYDTLNQSPTGLRTIGIAVGSWLVISHAFALVGQAKCRDWLKQFPFNLLVGRVLIALAGIWTYLLFQGLELGALSIPRMDMGEFYTMRPMITGLIPVATILVGMYCHEFLSVRALGCILLLVAAVMLDAAFLREAQSRLLLVVLAYVGLTKGLFWIGMPYLMRDQINWVTAQPMRWNLLCGGGIIYGIALVVCAFVWW